jgi:hypothetical protein
MEMRRIVIIEQHGNNNSVKTRYFRHTVLFLD